MASQAEYRLTEKRQRDVSKAAQEEEDNTIVQAQTTRENVLTEPRKLGGPSLGRIQKMALIGRRSATLKIQLPDNV